MIFFLFIYLFTYLFIFTFIYLSIYLFLFKSNLSIYFYYLLLFSLETVSPQKLLYLTKRQNFYYIHVRTIENISSFS